MCPNPRLFPLQSVPGTQRSFTSRRRERRAPKVYRRRWRRFLPPGAAIANDAIWQRNIASHAHLIAHRSNLLAMLNNAQSKMRSTKWYAGKGSPADALAWLQQHVHATPVPGTALIEVSIDENIDQSESAILINEIANHYLEGDRQRETAKLVDQINLFTNLKTRYEAQARSIRTQTSNLAAALQLDGMGRPGFVGQKEQELQLLTAEKLKAIGEATTAENAFKQATEEAQKGRLPGVVEMQVDQSWEIVSLRQQLNRLMELDAVNAQVEARIEATKQQLDVRRSDLRKTMTDAYLANLDGQLAAKKAGIETITKQIEHLKNDLAELGARLSEYLARRDEETAYRDLARRYADQLDQLNITRQRIDLNQIVFAARAGEPPK